MANKYLLLPLPREVGVFFDVICFSLVVGVHFVVVYKKLVSVEYALQKGCQFAVPELGPQQWEDQSLAILKRAL